MALLKSERCECTIDMKRITFKFGWAGGSSQETKAHTLIQIELIEVTRYKIGVCIVKDYDLKYFPIIHVFLKLGSKVFQYAWDSQFKIESKHSITNLKIIRLNLSIVSEIGHLFLALTSMDETSLVIYFEYFPE